MWCRIYLDQVNKGDVFAPFLEENLVHIFLNTKELLHLWIANKASDCPGSQELWGLREPQNKTLMKILLYSLILSPHLGKIGNQFYNTTLMRPKDS